ncbi:MAG TPA: hypothetical protein ENG74_02405, partial [Thermoplasmatales archaeon]|nr:hypothetical protein [Thermoplasmatales archaeon]
MVGFRINVTKIGEKIISRIVYRSVEMNTNTSSVVYVIDLNLPAGRYGIDISMAVYKLTDSGWIKADYELNEENNHLSKEIIVKSYPRAYAKYLSIEETKGGFKVKFYGYGIDRDSNELTYKWDFNGDGVTDYSMEVSNNSNCVFQNKSVEWVYSTSGNKQVIFQVIDEDGLSDSKKLAFGLWHIGEGDFDGDGLSSDEEKIYHTDPENPDTDNDSLPDGYEVRIGSDPLDRDSDDDHLPDNLEVALMVAFGYDPFDKPDTDNDGMINIRDIDSDGDGLYDGDEVICCNPERAEWIDSWSGYNPYSNDTDGDNLEDGEEISRFNTNPLNPDTDDDGLEDDKEIFLSTNPRKRDTDDDGIVDSLDLQPFSGKIEPYIGYYPVFSNMIEPNLVKFNGTVEVYHIQGRAYRKDAINWYKISSSNVRSKFPTANDVLNYDWSPYRALHTTKGETVNPPRGIVEGCIDSFPPYYKVRYYINYTNFRTTFINSKRVTVKSSECGEMWGSLLHVPCYQKGNHTLVMQFSIEPSQDRYYFSENRYTIPAFICKFYNDSSLEEKGSFLEIVVPFVRIDNHVYQVNIPIPKQSDYIYLFLIPVWVSRFDAIQSIRFMRGDIFSFGSLSRMIQIGNEQFLYGYANFEDISYRFSLDDWLDEERYNEDKIFRSLIVQYVNDVYTLDEETVNEYFYRDQQWTLYRLVKKDRERILEIKSLDDFVEEAKKAIKERMEHVENTKSALEDFIDAVEAARDYSSSKQSSPLELGVDVVTSITLRETSTIVAVDNKVVAKMMRLYNPIKAAYQEVKELRVEYGEFKEFLEKARNARRAASGGREIEDISSMRFIKKVVMNRARTLRSPLKSAGFYATTAIGAVEIGVYLYEASQTDDTFEKSYYLASATV